MYFIYLNVYIVSHLFSVFTAHGLQTQHQKILHAAEDACVCFASLMIADCIAEVQ